MTLIYTAGQKRSQSLALYSPATAGFSPLHYPHYMIQEKSLPPIQAGYLPPYREKDGYGGEKPKSPMVVRSSPTSPSSQSTSRPDISTSPQPWNRINLQTRFADISGTHYITPHNVLPGATQGRKKRKQKQRQIPDAVFRSRRGNLSLDLATSGYASEVAKATVVASTNSGAISLNLISGAKIRPRFDVESNTRSGNIVLFIPPSFSGAIQLHTKTGDLNFLPGIASEMRVVKSTDTEFLVFFGAQQLPGPEQAPADFCRLRTRSGNITVGLRDRDTYSTPSGLWERLTGFFRS